MKARPAVGVQVFLEDAGIALVHFAHARVVALEESAVAGELGAHALVLREEVEELLAEFGGRGHAISLLGEGR